ncbi:hypothetical protein GC176_05565 [bacterium]|nr:hypothetical protein [bacterium]
MNLTESVTKSLSEAGSLAPRFYDRFFGQVPQAQDFFEGISMTYQAAILRRSLQVVEQVSSHRYEAVTEYLRVLGFKHRQRGIPQELYAEWRDSLLDALEEFHGSDWTGTLETEWIEALNQSIDRIIEGYQLSSAAI